MFSETTAPTFKTILSRVGVVALGYFVFARLGLLLPYVGTHVTLIWLPTGIAVAALWRWGDRMLAGIFLGVAITYFSRPVSHPATLFFLAGNTLAPWVAVQLLRRFGMSSLMRARRDIPALLVAALAGMLVSSCIGVLALWGAGLVQGMQLYHAWVRWWVGDVVGVLLAAPPLMMLTRRALKLEWSGVGRAEWAACMVLALASGALVFLSGSAPGGSSTWLKGPMVFVPFLPLTWLAVRSSHPFYPALAVLMLAGIAAVGTSQGLGPVGPMGDPHVALSVLWGYLVSLALVVLLLGAVAAEAAHSAARLQGLFLSSRDAILIGRPGGHVDAANPAAQGLFGLDEDEIRRRGRAGLVDVDDPHLQRLMHDLDLHGSAQAMARAIRGDGRLVEIDLLSSRHIGLDGIQRSYAVMRDITERLSVERELQFHRDNLESQVRARTEELDRVNLDLRYARDAAESANRAKSAFLANMSHEIRTPINAIIGLSHLLRREATQPRQREQLGKVGDAADHLLHVINDVLDLSKIEAGRYELDQVDFSLAAVVDSCRTQVAAQAQRKGLKLRVEMAGVPEALRGDPTRLAQALLNLLSNAVKFTQAGQILLRIECVDPDPSAPMLRFSVLDSGVGIAAAELSKLFVAFTQADASTTRRFGGTGLGLTITRHLAELMGGQAGARSELGRGSEFWLTARFAAGAPVLHDAPVDHEAAERLLLLHHAGTRVLLAEDNAVNQEVALALMESVGLQVDVAVNGLEAVEKARTGGYALILMDVQMPQMDGLEATRQIRSMAHLATTPIVAMTANAYGEERLSCLRAGMNEHLGKPVEPELLFATLLRWLSPATTRPPTPARD